MQVSAKKQKYLDCMRVRVHARVYICPSAPVCVYVCVCRCLSCMCACQSRKKPEMKAQDGSSR